MTTPLKLPDLVEPVFLFVCRVNRLLRNGVNLPYEQVRQEALGVIEKTRNQAHQDARLLRQFEQIELPLVFFLDGMLVDAPAPWAQQWSIDRLAAIPSYGEVGGNDKFFELLEKCMKDLSEDASERLAVFFTCVTLGFAGPYHDQGALLLHKMQQIAQRLRKTDLMAPATELFPSCYNHTDTSVLPTPASATLTPLVLCFAGLLFLLLAFFVYRYRQDSGELYDTVRIIHQSAGSTSPK